ncbi:hypothetical protein CSOJ01_05693 [Colletotrichum sojae]|uniref:Uncharacterized protein n=1 Tax=Colletotrichum sojae TaxID=2175907 RepID=A0A8H6JFF8_9PEZI|nr:hypothetical protein CSOJ01_05693 [Colletotrichum sojae]
MANIAPSTALDLARRLDAELTNLTDKAKVAWALKSFNDLTPEEQILADDIILDVYVKNRFGRLIKMDELEAAREKLWNLVFDNNWNTNCRVPIPGPVDDRAAACSIIKVGGTLDRDAETPNKRKANGDMSPPPPHRCRGADAFIKVNINWTVEDLTFPLCDARRTFFSDIAFTKSPGLPGARPKRLLSGLKSGLRGREIYVDDYVQDDDDPDANAHLPPGQPLMPWRTSRWPSASWKS